MPDILGPIATTDNYPSDNQQQAAVLICSEVVRVNITISGNPAWYQLRDAKGGWIFEDYLASGPGLTFFFSLDRRCRGIRFRSATVGKSATVVASLLSDWEITQQQNA